MVKTLSRSTRIMFIFDLLVLSLVTFFCYECTVQASLIIEIISVSLIVICGLFSLYLKGNYTIREHNLTKWNFYRLFEGVVFANIPSIMLLFFFVDKISILKFAGINIILVFVLLALYRAGFHYYLFNLKIVKNILIIGTGKNARLMADEIIDKKALNMKVVGFVEDMLSDEEYIKDDKFKYFKSEDSLKKIIKENKVDIIIVAIKRRMEEELLTKMVLEVPKKVKIYKMPEFYEMVTGKYFIDKMSVNWLFYDYMKNRSKVYDFCKRAFDIIAASIILTVTLPVLLYISIRIKLTDGDSPIYTQTRVGKNGKLFKAYKLRTMYANNYKPTSDNISEVTNIDDRVIPWCKFVRKARLDEIPQMINILKGEMSIVGPRTEWDEVVKIYQEQIPYYACRMWVKTGWTGWAQINQGHLFSVDDEAGKLVYDLYYIKHRNILWEICILIKAVFLALGGRHA